jgi:hypothetical protein
MLRHDVAYLQFHQRYIGLHQNGAPDSPKHLGARWYSKYTVIFLKKMQFAGLSFTKIWKMRGLHYPLLYTIANTIRPHELSTNRYISAYLPTRNSCETVVTSWMLWMVFVLWLAVGFDQWRTQEWFRWGGVYATNIYRECSINLFDFIGQRVRGFWGGIPLERCSTQFANECNPYSD